MVNEKAKTLKGKQFDIEHCLLMYADGFCNLPAFAIYNDAQLAEFLPIIEKCHIYFIGYTPKIMFVNCRQEEQNLVTSYEILGSQYELEWAIGPDHHLREEDGLFFVEDNKGERYFPNETVAMMRLRNETQKILFDVKYIGQGYGKDGSRSALDRLKKHETLQKISLKGIPEGYKLELLLLELHSSNHLITAMNPDAENKNESKKRIDDGLDKLFNTTEPERITLYEASFIHYIKPEFNNEFKDSFPSTRMKLLKDCYDKDFSAVVAEINIDELPFFLHSKEIAPKAYHIAKHDLHTDETRKVFFLP